MEIKQQIGSVDAILNRDYGKIGTPEREQFRKEAYAYCIDSVILGTKK